MEIKKIYALIMMAMIFQSCGGQSPRANDFIGTWINADGATISFTDSGKFYAKNLPRGTMYFPEDQLSNKKFSGNGEWALQKGQDLWEIKLIFYKSANLNTGYATQILISGSSGFLDKTPPWFLFEWENGEGGQKYKFSKK